jgi:hypothetical protein
MVLNFSACVPVVCSVGIFNIYHWWSLLGNTTTIEAWEKDKVRRIFAFPPFSFSTEEVMFSQLQVATLIRRGKIKEGLSYLTYRLSFRIRSGRPLLLLAGSPHRSLSSNVFLRSQIPL